MPSINKAEKHNPALELFKPLVGTWKTEGHHPSVTDKTLEGEATFEWIYGGAFLLMRTRINNDSRFPDGIAIFGSDNGTGEYLMQYFDERDISRKLTVSVEGKTIRWWRDWADFSQRFELTIAEDDKTMTGKGEMRKDNGEWEPDLGLKYTRIK